MQWALGVLGWSPKEFWSATPIELGNAIDGWKISNGTEGETNPDGTEILSKKDVDYLRELMEEEA